MQMHLC